MEYLEKIEDQLKNISNEKYEWINIKEEPSFVFGTSNFSATSVDFSKFDKITRNDISVYGDAVVREMNNNYNSASGCRIRYSTTSKKIVIKVSLRRIYGYRKMLMWNSSGFDVYAYKSGRYIYKTVFAPMEGKRIFAETIIGDGKYVIFLPNYNTVEDIFIGYEKTADIKPLPYVTPLPIVFYGNSITQGSSASRSGNSFPNIVSRYLDTDIINISASSCCRGQISVADMIGKINCSAIVIDYSRNAGNLQELKSTYNRFYERIRKWHPSIPIVLLTSSCFNHWRDYNWFDEHIINYVKAIKDENTFLLEQKLLFEEDEWSLCVVDQCHYTDYGMKKVADSITDILLNKVRGR